LPGESVRNLQTTIQELKALNPGLYGIILNDSDAAIPPGYYRYYHRSKPVKTEIPANSKVAVIPLTAEVGIPVPSGGQESQVVHTERALIQRVINVARRTLTEEKL
jgi:hypothetical protein